MSLTGLLIVSSPFPYASSNLRVLLSRASDFVSKTLYVHFCPDGVRPLRPTGGTSAALSNGLKAIQAIYATSNVLDRSLDVRIPLDHLKLQKMPEKRRTQFDFDVVLTDGRYAADDLKSFLSDRFVQDLNGVRVVDLLSSADDERASQTDAPNRVEPIVKVYRNVVVGGTFDRLHEGHKIFLSEAAMRCSRSLTVGVTDTNMVAQKLLPELIESTSFRIESVLAFLRDVDPSVNHNAVPIVDPFGPSIVDPTLECVVVSQETVQGGHKINEERKKRGLSLLDVCAVSLLEDVNRSKNEELKMSSSSLRMRMLGKRLRVPEENTSLPKRPYIVGLTGGIASGKSSICQELVKLGAGIVYSDPMAHTVYLPGTEAHKQIVEYFGPGVLRSNGEINRQELGKLVFENKEKLDRLNKIVWPEVEKLLQAAVAELAQQGKSVIILEIPLLIEARMTKLVHEVWVVTVPPNEAVMRIQKRDGLSPEQAKQRVAAQMTNEERVRYAHILFCTLWDVEFTRQQVETAWSEVQKTLKNNRSNM